MLHTHHMTYHTNSIAKHGTQSILSNSPIRAAYTIV